MSAGSVLTIIFGTKHYNNSILFRYPLIYRPRSDFPLGIHAVTMTIERWYIMHAAVANGGFN